MKRVFCGSMFNERGFWVGWLSTVLMLGILGGCGTNAAQAPLSSPAVGAQVASSSELSELGSFADPAVPNGVVIWLRVPAPGRDIPLLGTLIGVQAVIDPAELLSDKLGASLSRTVDLSKPVDLTTSGLDDGAGSIVLAAGIFDAETFLSQVSRDFQVVHQSQGRWRLVPKAKPSPETLACELWHAPAPVGARLVCATQASLIGQQGPFLLAAARTRVDGANFHAEIPGSAARELLRKSAEEETKQKESSASENQSARAGRALGQQWVNDWGRDLGGLSCDLTLQRDSVELSEAIVLLHSDSVLSTAFSGRLGAPKPVPQAFWQLPSDSDAALYSEGAEQEPMRRQGAALINGLRRAMESDGEYDYPPAVLDQLEHSLEGLFLRGGAFELAYGRDLDRAARALNAAADQAQDRGARSGSADPALKKAQGQLGGWALIGLEDDSRTYLQSLRDSLKFAAQTGKYPRRKGAKPTPPSASSHTFRVLPLPTSAGLPPDSVHVGIRVVPDAKYLASKAKPAPPAPSEYHVFGVADAAQHLWFALSSDEALALSRLRAVLNPDPERTLAASADLRQLAKQPVTGLGFGSLAAFSGLSLSADSKAAVLDSRATVRQLWTLPKRGSTRMPIWITRSQSGATQRRIAVNLRLTPDALGDVLALLLTNSSDSATHESE
ncbi:MAG TPA: hypothetical protein VER12_05400 [Polyangiaceae bacterium]|nr:hypothetical protein [Polyangiaceae bacterium]